MKMVDFIYFSLSHGIGSPIKHPIENDRDQTKQNNFVPKIDFELLLLLLLLLWSDAMQSVLVDSQFPLPPLVPNIKCLESCSFFHAIPSSIFTWTFNFNYTYMCFSLKHIYT